MQLSISKNMKKKKKVLLAGGGSGGHVFPLLNVWEYMKNDFEVQYVGEKNGKEQVWVEERGINYQGISAGKLRRYFSIQNFIDIFKVPVGIYQSWQILRDFKPDLVFAKGGNVSFPVVIAAWWLKIPVLTHESDLVMGLANRMTASIADKIAVSFPVGAYGSRYSEKMIYTGLPVRVWTKKSGNEDEIVKSFGLNKDLPTVFVTGGSQGAMAVNSYILDHLDKILDYANVIHVSGETDFVRVREKTKDIIGTGVYKLYSFLTDNFNKAMYISEIVVSRASATTLAEISSMAKPSILIPLPISASNHQYFNAKRYEDIGASVMVEEREFKQINLAVLLQSILEDEEKYHEMSSSASVAMQTEGVSQIIIDLINNMIEEKR